MIARSNLCVVAVCFASAAHGCGNSSSPSTAFGSAGKSSLPVAGVSAGTSSQTPLAGTAGTAGTVGQAGQTGALPTAGTAAAGSGGTHAAVGGASGTAGASGAVGTAGATGGVGAGGASGVGGNAAGAGGASGTDCDRGCLLQAMQGYLDALVAKDPTKIKTSASLKYTENGVVVKLGDGLWKTASKIETTERLDFADPSLMNVVSQVVVDENGTSPVIYQARLKVVTGEITEIESMAVRQAGAANGFFVPANMKPEPAFLTMVDPSMRMTRDAMTALMNDYLDYLEGKKNGSQVMFDTMCKRYENGVATATGLAQFQSQMWSFMVTRRILVIDEEAGIVWGMFPFEQTDPSLVVGEAFKMVGGKIMMIQAVMANMPSKVWN